MKQVFFDEIKGISKWYHSLKRWQKGIVITLVVLFFTYWILVISDVSEWWHWSEWQEHIRREWK